MKYLLIAAVLALTLRKVKAAVAGEGEDLPVGEDPPPPSPGPFVPPLYDYQSDQYYQQRSNGGSNPNTAPQMPSLIGGMNPEIAYLTNQPYATDLGPGSNVTPAQLSAANHAYGAIINSIYPGLQQQYLNARTLSAFQRRAVEQRASLLQRKVAFHKRVLKKIF